MSDIDSKEEVRHIEKPVPLPGHKLDVAAELLAKHAGEAPITEAEFKQVRRKLDYILMPTMCFLFALQCIDKFMFGTTAIFGLPQYLGLYRTINGKLDTSYYSLASSMFYIGHIPGTLFLVQLSQFVPIGRFCSILCIIWGLIFTLTVVCRKPTDIFLERFFLGFVEGAIAPSFALLTGAFFTKAEQAQRVAVWWAMSGLNQYFNAPILVALMRYSAKWGTNGNEAFKLAYYVWGAITMAYGMLVWFLMPSSPTNAWFFNERQRYVAVERLRSNQAGVKAPFNWRQVREALLDIKVWILFCTTFCMFVVNAFIVAFAPLTLRGLGLSRDQSIYFQMVSGTVAIIFITGPGILAQRFKNVRTLVSYLCLVPALVAFVMLYLLPTTSAVGPRVFAVQMTTCYAGVQPIILSMVTANTAGYTKKTTHTIVNFIAYCLGSIAGPLMFKASEAPKYKSGFAATMAVTCIAVVLLPLHAFVCYRDNKKRDALGEDAQVDRAFQELTDKENISFRYVY